MREFIQKRSRWIAGFIIILHAWLLLGAAAPSTHVFSPLSPQIKGPTFDEYFYISAGVSYWKTGDYSENREHPPLTKMLTALPVALNRENDFPDHWRDLLHFPQQYFYEHNGERQALNLYVARLPVVALALLLDIVLFAVAASMAGPAAGIVTLGLAALDPSCIAAAATANLDFPAAAFCYMALASFRRALLKNAAGAILLAAVCLGLAMLSKLTALLLAPALLAMACASAIERKSPRPFLTILFVSLGAFTIFAAGYGFETRSLDSVKTHGKFLAKSKDAEGKPNILERSAIRSAVTTIFGWHRGVPLLTAVKGLDHTLSETGQIGHAGYLLGETTKTTMKKDADTGREFQAFVGWKSYYLAVVPQKLPLTTLLLVVAGMVIVCIPGKRFLQNGLVDRAFLFVFPATILLQFSFSNAQLGIKYVLPALFPLFTAAGMLAADSFPGRRRILQIGIVIIAVLGAAQATLRMHPDEAMFSSILAGGPASGARVGCVGDDWGQDAPGLAQFARDLESLEQARARAGGSSDPGELAKLYKPFHDKWGHALVDDSPGLSFELAREITKNGLAYRYYGEGEPSQYGYDFDVLGIGPRKGLIALHTTTLHRENEQFTWLERFDPAATEGEAMPGIYSFFVPGRWIVSEKPVAIIGNAILVYYIR